MARVQINNATVVESNPADTLLETMERAGLAPEYNCRDGHCGACKCSLISGEVEYVGFAMAYMQGNEILPCISRAKSDVELNNVDYRPLEKLA